MTTYIFVFGFEDNTFDRNYVTGKIVGHLESIIHDNADNYITLEDDDQFKNVRIWFKTEQPEDVATFEQWFTKYYKFDYVLTEYHEETMSKAKEVENTRIDERTGITKD